MAVDARARRWLSGHGFVGPALSCSFHFALSGARSWGHASREETSLPSGSRHVPSRARVSRHGTPSGWGADGALRCRRRAPGVWGVLGIRRGGVARSGRLEGCAVRRASSRTPSGWRARRCRRFPVRAVRATPRATHSSPETRAWTEGEESFRRPARRSSTCFENAENGRSCSEAPREAGRSSGSKAERRSGRFEGDLAAG